MGIESAERVQVKVFASETPEAEALIPVFHRWIREQTLSELMIDVADYSHVPEGPGVVLIGHASDYYFDHGEGRPGLLYSRKRDSEEVGGDDFEGRLGDAVSRLLVGCTLLAREGVPFVMDELLVRVPDRLHAPNDDASFEAGKTQVETALRKALGDVQPTVTRGPEGPEPLSFRVTLGNPPALDA